MRRITIIIAVGAAFLSAVGCSPPVARDDYLAMSISDAIDAANAQRRKYPPEASFDWTAMRPLIAERMKAERDAAEPDVRSKIDDGRVTHGMTQAEVFAAWGLPDSRDTYLGESGSSETWLYDRGLNGSQWVEFRSGRVIGIDAIGR